MASAQPAVDIGQYEYVTKCAVCHGSTGRGDGPLRPQLKTAPSDLTTYAKRNGGTFPTELAWQIIDGRPDKVAAHGPREMPVWGQEFRRDTFRQVDRMPTGPSPEVYVAARISMLIAYLERIQVK